MLLINPIINPNTVLVTHTHDNILMCVQILNFLGQNKHVYIGSNKLKQKEKNCFDISIRCRKQRHQNVSKLNYNTWPYTGNRCRCLKQMLCCSVRCNFVRLSKHFWYTNPQISKYCYRTSWWQQQMRQYNYSFPADILLFTPYASMLSRFLWINTYVSCYCSCFWYEMTADRQWM
jgi:hypothetical protein